MYKLPSGLAEFSAPDADLQSRIQQIRTNLFNAGDPKWRTYTDEDILNHAAVPYVPPAYVNQPKPKAAVREVSVEELMDILQTRERFPGYRSDVVITPQMREAIISAAKSNVTSAQANYGGQPFTIVPSYKGPDVTIPDALAISALANSKTVVPLPVTDFAPSKHNTSMNKRFNDRHPVSFNALVEPIGSLDSFAAFAEVATSTGTSNWGTSLLGLANTAAQTYAQIEAAKATSKAATTNAYLGQQQQMFQQQMLAQQAANQKKDTNWMPFILVGVGAVVLIGLVGASRRK